MTNVYQLEGIVLHSKDFSEKDVLLTLLSKERGKIIALCKGVKKPVSRLRAAAQLFSHARFFLYEGKSLPVITQADTVESFKNLSADLATFAAVSYWAELTEILLPEREMNFHTYILFLKSLQLLNKDFSWALFFAYQIKLLTLAGFEPVVESCAGCGGELGPTKFLSPAHGGTICSNCAPGRKQALEGTLQCLRLFKKASLETVTKLKISRPVTLELQKFLLAFAEYHTDHKVKSAGFLQSME